MTEVNFSQVLKEKFGFSQFREGQLEILESLSKQQDTLAILPTGSGKSLIYQMYGFTSNQRVLIVTPLLSLIQDQIGRLQLLGEKKVTELSSRQTLPEQERVLNNLQKFQFIFTSPETLQKDNVRQALKTVGIGLLVIDEAHCIVQWGKSFRPDYLKLGEVRKYLGKPTTLMLTATASKKTRAGILKYMNLDSGNVNEFITSVDRPNIYLGFKIFDPSESKLDYLLELLPTLPSGGIIYFSSRKAANQVSDLISNQLGLRVAPYHAGMSNYERHQIQSQFANNRLDLICATSAFGMGIDKDNIRYVVHFHMPGDIESYVQEIGRAGRDGQPSAAIMLYQLGDEKVPSLLNNFSIPSEEMIDQYFEGNNQGSSDRNLVQFYQQNGLKADQIKNLFQQQHLQKKDELAEMLHLVNEKGCHRQYLLQHFDQEFNQHDDNCCGGMEHLPTFPKNENADSKVFKMIDWQEKINSLFN
ncbi:RecQ family ATP-dependent DNA helicase [Pediococcus argentinicus]|uniref:ATP-dependent DNA helicase RecQ n=1 Tax=Pediococcus argentinicus TaxID=480391 RepID=A0A0R2NNL4_9LACO|nr:RecQ family ATP-dependent DNA helicase [Pediococcus argentinicus]KRO26283.1 ATP-dependent DNA helicase RecQ [Pediococcus argentinicus]NKZ21525.1 ATP-dependent DNA helicase RecQ [Pediococcus argentinicus]GEP18676.1 ATP-dependent DNA helicase [Pediococcus argentinicus]